MRQGHSLNFELVISASLSGQSVSLQDHHAFSSENRHLCPHALLLCVAEDLNPLSHIGGPLNNSYKTFLRNDSTAQNPRAGTLYQHVWGRGGGEGGTTLLPGSSEPVTMPQ